MDLAAILPIVLTSCNGMVNITLMSCQYRSFELLKTDRNSLEADSDEKTVNWIFLS